MIGVVTALLVASLVWSAKQLLFPGARTFTTTCSGAKLTGTIWLDSSSVVASIVVNDQKQRSWDLDWGAYNDEVGGSTLEPTPDGDVLSAAHSLGDIDDGTHRTARLRPDGREDWCELKMNVYRFW